MSSSLKGTSTHSEIGERQKPWKDKTLSELIPWLSNTEEGRDFILYDGVLARAHHNFETRWREMIGDGSQRAYPPFSQLSMYHYRSPLNLYDEEKPDMEEDKPFQPGEESDMEEEQLSCGDDEDDEWENEEKDSNHNDDDDVFLELPLTRPFIERTNKTCVVFDDVIGMLCVSSVYRGSMCRRHYERWRKTSDSRCSMEGCDKVIKWNGMCQDHILLSKDKPRQPPKKCTARDDDDTTKECPFPQRAKGLCSKHYQRNRRMSNKEGSHRQMAKSTSPKRVGITKRKRKIKDTHSDMIIGSQPRTSRTIIVR